MVHAYIKLNNIPQILKFLKAAVNDLCIKTKIKQKNIPGCT